MSEAGPPRCHVCKVKHYPCCICTHEWLVDDEVVDGEPTGGWVRRCSKCHVVDSHHD